MGLDNISLYLLWSGTLISANWCSCRKQHLCWTVSQQRGHIRSYSLSFIQTSQSGAKRLTDFLNNITDLLSSRLAACHIYGCVCRSLQIICRPRCRSSRLSAPGCSMQGSGWRVGRSLVSLSRLKLGKLKVVRRQLLQRYEHQPFVSCLGGLYGCQWRRYQRAKTQPGECCCSRVRTYARTHPNMLFSHLLENHAYLRWHDGKKKLRNSDDDIMIDIMFCIQNLTDDDVML